MCVAYGVLLAFQVPGRDLSWVVQVTLCPRYMRRNILGHALYRTNQQQIPHRLSCKTWYWGTWLLYLTTLSWLVNPLLLNTTISFYNSCCFSWVLCACLSQLMAPALMHLWSVPICQLYLSCNHLEYIWTFLPETWDYQFVSKTSLHCLHWVNLQYNLHLMGLFTLGAWVNGRGQG